MAHLKLIKPFHNCEPGDVIDIPAVIARELQAKQIGYGGAIDVSEVKDVDFSVPTPEYELPEPTVETVQPKKSKDYTIAELRDMDLSGKDDSFFEGDKRSTIDKLR